MRAKPRVEGGFFPDFEILAPERKTPTGPTDPVFPTGMQDPVRGSAWDMPGSASWEIPMGTIMEDPYAAGPQDTLMPPSDRNDFGLGPRQNASGGPSWEIMDPAGPCQDFNLGVKTPSVASSRRGSRSGAKPTSGFFKRPHLGRQG